MFEQVMLSDGPAGKRIWATGLGVAGESLLIVSMILGPLMWAQSLPKVAMASWLLTPPPPPPPKGIVAARPKATQAAVMPMNTSTLAPIRIPHTIQMVEDAPEAADVGIAGAVRGDPAGSGPIIGGIGLTAVTPVPRPVATPLPPVAAAPPEIQRVKVGGDVKMARLLRRVDPVYPAIARTARVSGTVELTGVIGIDGHIRELQVLKGNILLVQAALDAVRQWIYEPTLLNKVPVEVIAPITVTFRLDY